ncbi:phenylacetyl-CoA ligase [Exophiala viscosa]|uniref:Phenylacetyl-CoA ligase n=1 Tax=Exophiala viscosa TaxID=2486360 RepID=A0AAN6DXS6_9EURO|nr:phenylacetyl-CoA ligase [Exophiala viscosa]KAI1621329.1 phenylacetyl-CoA ligase [Exophiala viscosa]
MPFESEHAPISIPNVDIWTFLFERTDRVFPDNHVVLVDVSARKQHTFQDVRQTAERFGRGLRHHWNWQKGDVMAIFSPNNVDIAPVTFGSQWAGGVVCPFNNQYTAAELASQLSSSRSKAMATHVACLEVAKEAALLVGLSMDRIILVGDHDPKGLVKHYSSLLNDSTAVTKATINPEDDVAFLVYSSGTTGLPKGVMLTHKNIVANVLQVTAMDLGEVDWREDRYVGFLPMYHIYGLAVSVLAPVYRGLPMYIMQKFELERLCQVIQDSKITMVYIVPPVVLLLAKHPAVAKYDLSSVRMLHSSAAPLTKDLVDMVYKRLNVPIKQGYGLSEAAPGVASQSWSQWQTSIGSVGKLCPSMSLKFVGNGKEVPVGETGELWIKGPNIFKGYYDNPNATAESLDTEGWYRTGDIGYIDNDKNIYTTDRVKELIKYNGFQVAPAQLEGLLLANPAVNDVAVVGVFNEERATELPRAYIVPAQGYKADMRLEKEINGWLNQRVAPYKRLRGGIRFIDVIPKSAAGKVLRRVLAEQAKNEKPQMAGRLKL